MVPMNPVVSPAPTRVPNEGIHHIVLAPAGSTNISGTDPATITHGPFERPAYVGGIILLLDIVAPLDTRTIIFSLLHHDPVSGVDADIDTTFPAAPLVAINFAGFLWGQIDTGIQGGLDMDANEEVVIPGLFKIRETFAGAGTLTYSLAAVFCASSVGPTTS